MFPVLVRVTARGELCVPTDWLPKARLVADRSTMAPVPEPGPVSVIICGLPLALSVMLTTAERLPAEAGVNVTLIVQLAPAATEEPQVVVSPKSPGLAPNKPILTMFSTVLPVLVRVTDCAALVVPRFWLPKAKLLALRLTEAPVPVPVRVTVCGLPAALSAMVNVAVRLPAAAGVNVTLIVQVPPPASELPQVLVWEKSPPLVPVTVMLVKLKVALPLLVTVTVWAAAGVPTNWLPKVRMLEERPTPAEEPEPVRDTDWGLPAALSVNTNEAVLVPEALGVNVRLSAH